MQKQNCKAKAEMRKEEATTVMTPPSGQNADLHNLDGGKRRDLGMNEVLIINSYTLKYDHI